MRHKKAQFKGIGGHYGLRKIGSGFRVDVIFIGVILFGSSVCQPAQRAEEPTVFMVEKKKKI